MGSTRFAYTDIGREELLWVCYINKTNNGSVEYNYPALVKMSNHNEVVVRYGNISSFSTLWVHRSFNQRGYEHNPEMYPTVFAQEKELIFRVKDDKVTAIKKGSLTIELQRYPVRLYAANPYNRIHARSGYGDFKDISMFADRVWELECERPFPRFSESTLREHVGKFFVKTTEATATIKYPVLCGDSHIIRDSTEQHYIDAPSGREGILKVFMENYVPYLVDQDWWDLVRRIGLNNINYHKVLAKVYKAYLEAKTSSQQAISFNVPDHEGKNLGIIIQQLDLPTNNWLEQKQHIVLIQTKDMTTKLGSSKAYKIV
jgi:hypothetical protein